MRQRHFVRLASVRRVGVAIIVLIALMVPSSTPPAEASVPGTATSILGRVWFDACSAPSYGDMVQMWNNSPYYAIGIYIGGENRSCSQSQLTYNWVSAVHDLGFDFVPIWVGPQAPCQADPRNSKISSDPNTAHNQGQDQAYAAMNTANTLGMTENTIIYYDMEGYDPSCELAANSFLSGWDEVLKGNARWAGAYSSACYPHMSDLAGIPSVPDNIWFAHDNTPRTVWGEGCIPDSLWKYQQRHHQYAIGYTGTWGSATLEIDASCGGGRVAGYHQYNANPQYPDACPFP